MNLYETRMGVVGFSMVILLWIHSVLPDNTSNKTTDDNWNVTEFQHASFLANASIHPGTYDSIVPFGKKRDVVHQVVFDGARVLVGYTDRLSILLPENADEEKEIRCNAGDLLWNRTGIIATSASGDGVFSIFKIEQDYSIDTLGTYTVDGYAHPKIALSMNGQNCIAIVNEPAMSDGPDHGMAEMVFGRFSSQNRTFAPTWNGFVLTGSDCYSEKSEVWIVSDRNNGLLLFDCSSSKPGRFPVKGKVVALAPYKSGAICVVSLAGTSKQLEELAEIEQQKQHQYGGEGDRFVEEHITTITRENKLLSGLKGEISKVALDGSVLWRKKIAENEFPLQRPSITEDDLVIFCGQKYLWAVREGAIVWKRRLKEVAQEYFITSLSQSILVSYNSTLMAVDASRGKELWTIQLPHTVTTRAVVDENGIIYIGTVNGVVKLF